ncbi:MAG TPA: phosphatase PAP2 family protein [Bacteroidales bacterium]|nr:phosphatase PAP2 family protein [Bacteroidales bacterium]
MRHVKVWFLICLVFPGVMSFSQNPDIDLLRYINHHRNPALDNTFRTISDMAGPVAVATPFVLFGVSYLAQDTCMRHNSIYIGASLASAAVITTILKYSIDRKRPFSKYPDVVKLADGGSPSFPSGHTSDAFALATSLSLAYPKWYVIVPAYAWSSTVAFSRMDLGVHYPTDVLAGALIGAGTAWLCYKGQQYLHRKFGK